MLGRHLGETGLSQRTRGVLALVMLTALGRNHGLGVHLHGAITDGCSRTEIQQAPNLTAANGAGRGGRHLRGRIRKSILGADDLTCR